MVELSDCEGSGRVGHSMAAWCRSCLGWTVSVLRNEGIRREGKRGDKDSGRKTVRVPPN